MKRTLIIIVSVLLIVSGLGCVAMSEYFTPAEVDPDAIKYVVDNGIRSNDYYTGFPNLDKANKLVGDVDTTHEVVQFDLQQRMAKDDLDYSRHRDTVVSNRQTAVKRENLLFGETGLLSMGLSMAGFGTLTGLVGLLRKRPQDYTQQDFETAISSVKGEITAKDRQLIDIVKGVQEFIKTFPDQERAIKDIMDKQQDGDTQVAVAKIRASL